jgi:hypothetical protein
VAIGKAIEDLERQNAKGRKRQGRPKRTEGKFPSDKNGQDESTKGKTGDKVAPVVGMSGKTYEKAKAVVEAAEESRDLFGDLVARMDESGKVDPAFRELQKRKHPEPPEPPPPYPHSDYLTEWLHRISDRTHVIEIEKGGITTLLRERELWDWEHVEDYLIPQLECLSERIHRYIKELKEHARQKND